MLSSSAETFRRRGGGGGGGDGDGGGAATTAVALGGWNGLDLRSRKGVSSFDLSTFSRVVLARRYLALGVAASRAALETPFSPPRAAVKKVGLGKSDSAPVADEDVASEHANDEL